MATLTFQQDAPGLFDEPVESGEYSRSQILDHILAINPTAQWLVGEAFNRTQLWHYLQHLLVAQSPRGRNSAWIRPADSPGILAREAD